MKPIHLPDFFMSQSLRKFSLDLFLVAVFPSHLWAIYRSLVRGEFVYNDYGLGDMIGFIAYNLQYALIESILVSLVLVIVSKILFGRWRYERRLSVIVAAYLCVVASVVLRWGFTSSGEEIRVGLIEFINQLPGAISIYKYVFLALIILSISWVIARTAFVEKIEKRFMGLVGKVKLVSILYLILDGFGLLILIFRNVK